MTVILLKEALPVLGITFNGFFKARAKGGFRKVQLVRYTPRGQFHVIKESVFDQIKSDVIQVENV